METTIGWTCCLTTPQALFFSPSAGQTMDWTNAIVSGRCTSSVCIFGSDAIPASTFGQTASDCLWCATKRRWATNGTSLGVTHSGIWQCEQAELQSGPMTGFPGRALASGIFPTAPFQQPLSKFLRRSFSVPRHNLSCSRPHLPPFFAEPKLLSVKHQFDTHLGGGNSHLPRS